MIYVVMVLLFLFGYFLGLVIQYLKDNAVMKKNVILAYQKGVQDGRLTSQLTEAGYVTREVMDV